MSVSSFFAKKIDEIEKLHSNDIYTQKVLLNTINTSSCMVIFYSQENGWTGANKLFLDTFALKNMTEFITKYESIRDLFINENDDFFLQDDISWLDNIIKNKKDTYILSAYNASNDILTLSAKCHMVTDEEIFMCWN